MHKTIHSLQSIQIARMIWYDTATERDGVECCRIYSLGFFCLVI